MTLLASPSDSLLAAELTAELAKVEERFASELVSDIDCVNRLVAHIEQYRGKMLRPMLVLVTGLATRSRPDGPLSEAHQVVATVVEMVHMATLVHDDVLDEADVRRQSVTVNMLRGNETAVMLGDYLISHAYHLCSSLDLPWVSRTIAEATNTVCEGELLQLANRVNWELDERTYFEIIRRKTASLCGTSCRLAAMLSQCPPPLVEAMASYGENLGIAFQIVDDLLDVLGEEKTVGKTLGRDIEKGKLTLPLIHYLQSAPKEARSEMLRMLKQTHPESQGNGHHAGQPQPTLSLVRQRLLQSESLSYARRTAEGLVRSAQACLQDLPPSEARDLLQRMANAVLDRKN